MVVKFYTSSAGVAGDPHKLLVAETDGIRETEMYNTWSWFNLDFWHVRWKLLRKIKKQMVII